MPLTLSPVGTKKLVPASLSMSCMIAATSSGGKARRRRKPVTSIAQTKKGRRIQVMPRQRRLIIVQMKFTAPRRDEVISRAMPTSHCVWPVQNRSP